MFRGLCYQAISLPFVGIAVTGAYYPAAIYNQVVWLKGTSLEEARQAVADSVRIPLLGLKARS